MCLNLPGLDFLRTFEGDLDDDIIYTDDDDDDEDDDRFYTPTVSHRSLEPHPRIKQLSEEVFPLLFDFSLEVKLKSFLYDVSLVCDLISG